MEELIKLWEQRLQRFQDHPEVAKNMDPAVSMGVQHARVADSCHKIYGNLGEHQELF